MPALKNNNHVVTFRVSQEIRDNLEHHAKRLGTDMNDIVREATHRYLDELDEKEIVSNERKKARERKGAFVPEVIQHKWGTPPGLGTKKSPPTPAPKTAPATKIVVAEKFKKSFRRWAEWIEAAEDRSDSKQRVETVIQDIKDRATSTEEVDAVCEEFKDFMKARLDAKTKPLNVSDVGDAPVKGDVDDD